MGGHDSEEGDEDAVSDLEDGEGDGTEGQDAPKRKKKRRDAKIAGVGTFRAAVTGAAASIKLKREQRKQHRRHAISHSESHIAESLSKDLAMHQEAGIDIEHDDDDDSLAGQLESKFI